jgi:hypothetical protein
MADQSATHQIGSSPTDAQLTPPFHCAEIATFMQVRFGLVAAGATLAGGEPVETYTDTLRWLMQQIAANA